MRMNRCDSDTDSTVWMEEDMHVFRIFHAIRVCLHPESMLRVYFFMR